MVISLDSVIDIVIASIDYSDTTVEQSFRIIVTVIGVEGNCGEELKIIVAYKSDTFELYEGDELPLEEQRADPISSEGHEFVFPKDRLQQENHLMYVSKSQADSQIVRLTNSPAKQAEK